MHTAVHVYILILMYFLECDKFEIIEQDLDVVPQIMRNQPDSYKPWVEYGDVNAHNTTQVQI